jgi:gas vesicle protein
MRFLIGLFLGLGFGVVIGLLFAPQSGEATRAQLGERGIQLCPDQVAKDIQARAQEALVQGNKIYNRTKEELTERYARAKSGDFS